MNDEQIAGWRRNSTPIAVQGMRGLMLAVLLGLLMWILIVLVVVKLLDGLDGR
jgi:hypothetical protein